MLSRRQVLAGAPAVIRARAAARRPNFLFILADDHAGYVLGCDGNRHAGTPNLDRLASEGTRFAANYCNSPVCTPSRQSFLTGQMPHSAGVTVLRTALADTKPTLAKQLQQAGFVTAAFGKMHFNRRSESGLHGFDVMYCEDALGRDWNAIAPRRPIAADVRTKKLPWQPFNDPARVWLNADNLPYPRHEGEMRSAHLLRECFQYMEAHREKPFAIWVSFQEPHSPFDFPVEQKRVGPESFEALRVGPADSWQIPLLFRDLSDVEKRGITAAYYNSVRYLDRNIGRVLAKLRELAIEDNTFVVYMADHGYLLGQHGRFEKHCCYDPALRVPLMMRWPGRVRQGVVRDMTQSVDVPHTILDMLGAEPLPVQHGRSLRPYLERKRVQSRDHVFSEYLENEEACIRTEQWKFVFCSGKRERADGYRTTNPAPGRYVRLFNLKHDPGEFTDVAKGNAKIVSQMERLMLERFRDTHPDVSREPQRLSVPEAIEWYLRPRDAV